MFLVGVDGSVEIAVYQPEKSRVFVNDVPVVRQKLSPGDRIRIGRWHAEFVHLGPADPTRVRTCPACDAVVDSRLAFDHLGTRTSDLHSCGSCDSVISALRRTVEMEGAKVRGVIEQLQSAASASRLTEQIGLLAREPGTPDWLLKIPALRPLWAHFARVRLVTGAREAPDGITLLRDDRPKPEFTVGTEFQTIEILGFRIRLGIPGPKPSHAWEAPIEFVEPAPGRLP